MPETCFHGGTRDTTAQLGRSRAAALVMRAGDAGPEYLLVSASSDPSRLVLPAGKVEPGETPEAAAVRECREEAGAVVKPVCSISRYAHHKAPGATHLTDVFLAEWEAWTEPAEDRRRVWKSAAELIDPTLGLQPELIALMGQVSVTDTRLLHAA